MHRVVGYLVAAAAFTTNARGATPLELYGSLPRVENVVVSPDGAHLAFVRTEGDERFLAVISLDSGQPVYGVRAGDTKLRAIQWAGNRHILVVSSITRDVYWLAGGKTEWSQLIVVDIEKRAMHVVPEADQYGTMNVISGAPMTRRVDGRLVLFVPSVYAAGLVVPSLYRYDVESGEQELVEKGTPATRQWFVDAAGNVAGRAEYHDQMRLWTIQASEEGGYYTARSGRSALYEPRILGYGSDASAMLVEYPSDNDTAWRWDLVPFDRSTSATLPELSKQISEPLHDPVTQYLVGGTYTSDRTYYEFSEPTYRARWQAVLEAFPDARVRFESASGNFDKIVIRVDGPTTGFAYILLDLKQGVQQHLGPVYTGITERHETRQLDYPAADGLEIPGFLTLPSGKTPKGLPLVVLVHGGPAAQDTADFDWWPQALASQGYAVLQANFRGSTVSIEFMAAGFGEWGRKMQTDLSDGVRHLAAEGVIDPARVCIVGASYGGYAALAGVTLEPGVYRCAVSVAGIGDVKRMLEWEGESSVEREQRYWERFMGVNGPEDPIVPSISPAANAAAANVPVLLIHGKDDTVVPYEQSEAMLRVLRRADKTVEIVTLRREDHWLSRAETRVRMLQESVAFLRLHNPPD